MDPFTAALLIGSTGLGIWNQNRASYKQQKANTDALRQMQERQREATQRVQAEIEGMRTSTPEPERQAGLSQYIDAVRRGDSTVEGALPSVLNASERFQGDTAASRGAVSDYGRQMAELLARIDAPINQRQREAVGRGRIGADINQIANFAQGDDFVNRMRMNAIMPNPWVSALAQIGQGVAMGRAGAPADPSQTGATGWQGFIDRLRRTGLKPPAADVMGVDLGAFTPPIRGMNA